MSQKWLISRAAKPCAIDFITQKYQNKSNSKNIKMSPAKRDWWKIVRIMKFVHFAVAIVALPLVLNTNLRLVQLLKNKKIEMSGIRCVDMTTGVRFIEHSKVWVTSCLKIHAIKTEYEYVWNEIRRCTLKCGCYPYITLFILLQHVWVPDHLPDIPILTSRVRP